MRTIVSNFNASQKAGLLLGFVFCWILDAYRSFCLCDQLIVIASSPGHDGERISKGFELLIINPALLLMNSDPRGVWVVFGAALMPLLFTLLAIFLLRWELRRCRRHHENGNIHEE